MKIKDWLKDSQHWCKNKCGFDRLGDPLEPDEIPELAVSTCLIGAVYKCYPLGPGCAQVLEYLLDHCPAGIDVFNDTHTHAEVLALVEKLDV